MSSSRCPYPLGSRGGFSFLLSNCGYYHFLRILHITKYYYYILLCLLLVLRLPQVLLSDGLIPGIVTITLSSSVALLREESSRALNGRFLVRVEFPLLIANTGISSYFLVFLRRVWSPTSEGFLVPSFHRWLHIYLSLWGTCSRSFWFRFEETSSNLSFSTSGIVGWTDGCNGDGWYSFGHGWVLTRTQLSLDCVESLLASCLLDPFPSMFLSSISTSLHHSLL